MYPNNVLELAVVAFAAPPTKGMVMFSREEHPEKAPLPILVTPSGIVILVSPEQPMNA